MRSLSLLPYICIYVMETILYTKIMQALASTWSWRGNKIQISDGQLNSQHLLMEIHSIILWQMWICIMKNLAYSISFHVEKFFFNRRFLKSLALINTRQIFTWHRINSTLTIDIFFSYLIKRKTHHNYSINDLFIIIKAIYYIVG